VNRAGTLATLLALSAVWGTQFLVVRLAQAELPPWRAVALRFIVVAALGQIATTAGRARAPRGVLGLRLALGATQALSMGLLYTGQQRVPSALASVLTATTPLVVVVLARHWLRERILGRSVLAGALGLAGVALISGAHVENRLAAVGVALLLASALLSAVSKTIGKAITDLPIAILLRDLGGVVAVVALAATFTLERHVRWEVGRREIAAAVYLGAVASTGANALYFVLLRRVDVSRLSYLQFVSAGTGLLVGVLFAGEHLNGRTLTGAGLILAGAALHASGARPAKPTSSSAPAGPQPPPATGE